ncbi:hypothetical protein ACFSCX_06325 [Bacillus salitolerans]|uniref:Uncharacterized protein n=1 Tax=Bacillus salitolerans TaxID=1437434 RepID=A0ABW4LNA6_9BACI
MKQNVVNAVFPILHEEPFKGVTFYVQKAGYTPYGEQFRVFVQSDCRKSVTCGYADSVKQAVDECIAHFKSLPEEVWLNSLKA